MVFEILGKNVARLMPTIPQPAPSSRTLRLGRERRVSSAGRLGRGCVLLVMGKERVVR